MRASEKLSSFVAEDFGGFANAGERTVRALVYGYLILALSAALLAGFGGYAIRAEWLTPALDLMHARSFGALLTLHGAAAFYFALLPLAFHAPVVTAVQRATADGAIPFQRLAHLSLGLQALGLGVVTASIIVGGTEAGWSGAAIFGGRFSGAQSVGMAGLCAALALIVQGVQAVATPWARAPLGRSALSVPLFSVGWMGVFTGAVLALCMSAILLGEPTGLSLFDPAMGGDPLLYGMAFSVFVESALILCCFAPLLLAIGLKEESGPGVRGSAVLRGAGALAAAATLPFGGSWLVWKHILAIGAYVLLAALVVNRLAKWGKASALCWALMLAILGEALFLRAVVVAPFGYLFRQTTFDSATMHLASIAAVGFGFPLLVAPRAPGFPLVAALLVLFFGAQMMLVPDMVTGLQGLSFRANAYPPEFQTWRVLGSAGATLVGAGFLAVYSALWVERRATRTAAVVALAR